MKRMFNKEEAEQVAKEIMEKEIKELKQRIRALESTNKDLKQKIKILEGTDKNLKYLINAPISEAI